jgi:hypothetical protein
MDCYLALSDLGLEFVYLCRRGLDFEVEHSLVRRRFDWGWHGFWWVRRTAATPPPLFMEVPRRPGSWAGSAHRGLIRNTFMAM